MYYNTTTLYAHQLLNAHRYTGRVLYEKPARTRVYALHACKCPRGCNYTAVQWLVAFVVSKFRIRTAPPATDFCPRPARVFYYRYFFFFF